MSLIRIARTANRGIKASVSKIKIAPGFTKNSYFKWLFSVFPDFMAHGTLFKKSEWYGGLEIASRSGKGTAYLGAAFWEKTDQGFSLAETAVPHEGCVVVPVTDKEFEELVVGKSIVASYPEVLLSVESRRDCAKLVSAYMKKAGCRATKYVVCPARTLGETYDMACFLYQARAFLDCVGGRSWVSSVYGKYFLIDTYETKPALASMRDEAREMSSNIVSELIQARVTEYGVYLPSLLSHGVALDRSAFKTSVKSLDCNYVDVSTGTIDFKYFSSKK
jgi:hypothetical protein